MSLLNIGMSGLTASMAALNTTSNNVANAAVPGYSRQQLLTSSVAGGGYGGGAGVNVDGIRRISDQYQVAQLWNTSSGVGYASTQQSYHSQVETVFNTDGNNISQGLDTLFAALNASMEKPNETAYRQGVLNEANALSQRINSINDSLSAQTTQIESQMGASVNEINTQIETIARLNSEIQSSANNGTPSASLLDSRDAAIDDLANIIDIRVTEESNGMVNISLSQGQPLLAGTTKSTLVTSPSTSNPTLKQINIQFGQSSFPVDKNTGGSLGALLDYRDNDLADSITFVNEMAKNLADEFNRTLKNGTDLNGATPKLDLFSYDPSNPAGTLGLTSGFTSDMLAFGQNSTPGDNSNLRDLVEIANTNFTFGSINATTSMGDAFAAKIGQLGSTARQANLNADTSTQLQMNAQSQWSSTSGVNLDEEGVNLIKYQQQYQANAKIISTADQLFQTLLNSI
ncbi:flagellar hook-associated protein FlgK [Shewanella surugensis]|uniref:Flagellar hook-associated protein 1 n=1 Tax=Shewanella surugensis TaxID=212020 RepID=A0ABT0LBN7_9GAMM|nr:flagellar hook-associated protein FlgK [Shewanella surugensis]MCL1124780.1 flagellar hook-associated protein FlgK [Shewanella surugensis]